MASEATKTPLTSRIFFRIGQIAFLIGYIFFLVGIGTSHWVDRPAIDVAARGVRSKVALHYGIFEACLQLDYGGDVGLCDSVWENLNYVDENAAQFVQALMIIAALLLLVGSVLEVLQIIPLKGQYRNFLAKNRVVELFSAVAAVVALCGIVVFAGEIKNKAERVNGQDEESVGYSFILTVLGLVFSMLGVMTVTMFRELPVPKEGEKGGSWMRF